jgi:hypothetical protein
MPLNVPWAIDEVGAFTAGCEMHMRASEQGGDNAHRNPRASASRLAVHDRLEGPAGPPGVVAQGGGNARCPGRAQDGDASDCRCGRHLWFAGEVVSFTPGLIFHAGGHWCYGLGW